MMRFVPDLLRALSGLTKGGALRIICRLYFAEFEPCLIHRFV